MNTLFAILLNVAALAIGILILAAIGSFALWLIYKAIDLLI